MQCLYLNWTMQMQPTLVQNDDIREGFKKSKWKFKMAFAMKGGGGVSRGSRVPHTYFEK